MLAALIGGLPLRFIAAETAEEAAARQEAEDNYKRISARVDDLFSAIESLQKRFSAMQDEVRKMHDEVARASEKTKDTSSQDNLKQLAKAIEEVDKKRVADRDKLLSAFADLEKSITSLANAPKPKESPTTTAKPPKTRVQSPKGESTTPSTPEKGYEYTVLEGDTLNRIVLALNKQGMKLTAKQISDANPNVNWNRLPIGHKIFIPEP